jgi:hypothetical protein
MCLRLPRAIVVGMTTTTITLVLDLDETTDSLLGRVRLADGNDREFHGWLGLAEVIDSLTRASASLGHAETTQEKETS